MVLRAEPGRIPPLSLQAQQLVQVEAAKVQEELANTVVEGFSSDETVRPAPWRASKRSLARSLACSPARAVLAWARRLAGLARYWAPEQAWLLAWAERCARRPLWLMGGARGGCGCW